MFQDRFNRMLDPNTNQTLWEEWWRNGTGRTGKLQKRTRSDAQTESAFPPALFGEYILGIRALEPGLRTVALDCPDCGLSQIEGSMPTPLGLLSVKWDLKKKDLHVDIPEGIQVHLDPLLKGAPHVLSKGKHHVHF